MRKEAALEQRRCIAEANRVLTNDEVVLIIIACRELSVMGLGIDEDTCLVVVTSVLLEKTEEKYFVLVTRGFV